MPKLLQKLDRNTKRIHPIIDPTIVDQINDLLATGDFNGLSHLVRKAIEELHRKYQLEGKLKSISVKEEGVAKDKIIVEKREPELTPEEQELVEMARKGEIQPDMEKVERKVKR